LKSCFGPGRNRKRPSTRRLSIARRLKRENAYDASYIALAQELEAELWTLDGPLARNAAGTDLPVRLIETK
jgi:predicted nucleic acid-binding protein